MKQHSRRAEWGAWSEGEKAMRGPILCGQRDVHYCAMDERRAIKALLRP